MARQTVSAAQAPHSWPLTEWPTQVYPGNTARARYLVRTYRDEFLREGVMCRVGRELVFLGAKYVRWLEKRAAYVPGYVPVPNRIPAGLAGPQA